MKHYSVTRQFTSGPLAGLTFTEVTTVYMPVGFTSKGSGSSYVVTSIAEVA